MPARMMATLYATGEASASHTLIDARPMTFLNKSRNSRAEATPSPRSALGRGLRRLRLSNSVQEAHKPSSTVSPKRGRPSAELSVALPPARLLLWVCNRFDYGAVGDPAWAEVVRGLAHRVVDASAIITHACSAAGAANLVEPSGWETVDEAIDWAVRRQRANSRGSCRIHRFSVRSPRARGARPTAPP